MRFAAAAETVDGEIRAGEGEDEQIVTPPIHAFEVVDGFSLAERSACDRMPIDVTDMNDDEPADWLDVPAERRCGLCDTAIGARRAGFDVDSHLLGYADGGDSSKAEILEPLRAPDVKHAADFASHLGDRVIFRYNHGEEVEGVISSTNVRFVFVRFHRSDGTLKDDAEACDPTMLRLA